MDMNTWDIHHEYRLFMNRSVKQKTPHDCDIGFTYDNKVVIKLYKSLMHNVECANHMMRHNTNVKRKQIYDSFMDLQLVQYIYQKTNK